MCRTRTWKFECVFPRYVDKCRTFLQQLSPRIITKHGCFPLTEAPPFLRASRGSMPLGQGTIAAWRLHLTWWSPNITFGRILLTQSQVPHLPQSIRISFICATLKGKPVRDRVHCFHLPVRLSFVRHNKLRANQLLTKILGPE